MAAHPGSNGTAFQSTNRDNARRTSDTFSEAGNSAKDKNHAGNGSTEKYRKVSLDDIVSGPNQRGFLQSRLIVPEEDNPEFVKEYTKRNDLYYCVGCRTKAGKINSGRIECNWFFTPIIHYSGCYPLFKKDALTKISQKESRLTELKIPKSNIKMQGQTKCSPAAKLNAAILDDIDSEEEKQARKRRSPSIEIIEVVQKSPEKSNNERQSTSSNTHPTELKQGMKRITEETLPDFTPSKVQKLVTQEEEDESISSAVTEQNDAVLLQSDETEKLREYYRFNHPSVPWLRKACEKLNINYTLNAYKFWGNIDIEMIKETFEPEYIQRVKGGKNSSSRALSFLLSGEENKKVKKAIQDYFFDNYKSLGTILGHDLTVETEIVKETILSETITPILWETIARLLQCRIGIFENRNLLKYGNWNNIDEDDEIVTLLFEKDNDDYTIVTKLLEAENVVM